MKPGQIEFAGRIIETAILETRAIFFFKTHGSLNLLGPEIWNHIRSSAPEQKFGAFRAACGYKEDPAGFFIRISGLIQKRHPVVIHTIKVPVVFLTALLEVVYPEDRSISVRSMDQMDSLLPWGPGREDKEKMEKILDLYPVRLSDHVIRQSMVSRAVSDQYLPFEGELDPWGLASTFEGHFRKGIMEQMYRNRVIFLLGMECPVYCRFCFRKHKDLRREKSPDRKDILSALSQVRKNKDIREILITGGEPFLYPGSLEAALDGLTEMDHIQVIRIATRSISYFPKLFLKNKGRLIQYLQEKHLIVREKGKQLEIGVHFIHPDEISIQSLSIITRLTRAGIRVYLQTPFLKGVNNEGPVLATLFSRLRNAGVKIYYIFTPCHPIQGTKKFETSISDAIEAFQYLRAHLSDRAMPKLCTATSLGKIEWETSGWAVEPDSEFIWIRTPYTLEYFKGFTPDQDSLPHVRENREGTLDVRMLARAGDLDLFRGKRGLASLAKTPARETVEPYPEIPGPDIFDRIHDPGLSGAIRPDTSMIRTHKTRVEIDLSGDAHGLEYIRSHPEITDVVIRGMDLQDPDPVLDRADKLAQGLKEIDSITCIRICCAGFARHPEALTRNILDRISQWGRFSLADPVGIEIETWFVRPEEIGGAHAEAVREIRSLGLEIYANLPLISGVNNTPSIMVETAHNLRRAGIEFHHLYAAGLDIQNRFNRTDPIETETIINIASKIRKECSGREIPLYMIQTPLGEVDFGLCSSLIEKEGRIYVGLEPYDLGYFRATAPGLEFSDNVIEAPDGKLYVGIQGLALSSG
ncbi:radical SAM protein [Desulfospira joergensenii]|uniref:radical SAM protein n=1 Tax=Desulfospira joergensenii TaxID=53329 RepID=UPI0003B693FF|nr:radical SAM protein [Desulfospira joergensenii]